MRVNKLNQGEFEEWKEKGASDRALGENPKYILCGEVWKRDGQEREREGDGRPREHPWHRKHGSRAQPAGVMLPGGQGRKKQNLLQKALSGQQG